MLQLFVKFKKLICAFLIIVIVTCTLIYLKQYSFTYFKYSKLAAAPQNAILSLILVGDITFARGVNNAIQKQHNLNYPLQNIAQYLQSADFVFGNLESVISKNCLLEKKFLSLCSDPKYLELLAKNKINLVGLANNHIGDYGIAGLQDTINNLQQNHIQTVGAGVDLENALQPKIIRANGVTVAILSVVDSDLIDSGIIAQPLRPGVAPMNINLMQHAIKLATKQADFVIVSMHAGNEYQATATQRQITFAHAAIDAGAILVVGHHSHVIQSAEKYHNGYIFYSLGNFIFDQMRNEDLRYGMTLKIFFTKRGIALIEVNPTYEVNLAQPSLVVGEQASLPIAKLQLLDVKKQPVFYWDQHARSMQQSWHYVIQNQALNAIPNMHKTSSVINLSKGRLKVLLDKKLIWSSRKNWWIDEAMLTDVTNRGTSDVVFSLWKNGNYFKPPFWHNTNEWQIRNHFFIYKFNNGKLQPHWGSSNISAPICKFAVADINHDGENELIVLEGDYKDYPNCTGKDLAVWKWNGWGFENFWQSKKGEYNDFVIYQVNAGDMAIMAIKK